MRRIAIAVMSTISGMVLLFSYHTSLGHGTIGTAAPIGGTGTKTGTGGTSGTGSTGSGSTGTGSSGSGSAAAGTLKDGTYTGGEYNTQWGPVQVQITVQGGKITASTAVVYPNNNFRDQEINSYALPILAQEAVQAQSAQIDAVSGATVTSSGYIPSLQSAIDKAHQA